MKDDHNKKHEEQETEEPVEYNIEEKNKTKPKSIETRIKTSLILHPQMTISLFIHVLVNMLTFAVVSGFLNQIKHTVTLEWYSFLIGVILFTLIEFTLSLIVLKFFLRIVLYTLGGLLFLTKVVSFYIINLLVVNFKFASAEGLLIFTICFTVLRVIINVYIKKYRLTNLLKKR